ncbi:MAG: phospholipase [Chloroflexi bacterium]|nr:phospholipase [Chloroflexota bacterium]
MAQRTRGDGRGAGSATEGRLKARPGGSRAVHTPPSTTVQSLGLASGRDGLLYVPPTYEPGRPAPLVLMLHGAGGNARQGLSPLLEMADRVDAILVAPDSRRQTWDVLASGFGPDVEFIDRALDEVFARFDVDPSLVAIEGFSDGASYALSLGLTNGDLFTHVIAFSPGFSAPGARAGTPRIYVSHGIGDMVLPIGSCSRRLVPALRRAGYDLTYQEFAGPHVVPDEIASEALNWFLESPRVRC